MGNSLGCSASGERLVSAARDGDAIEARMLLELSPALARYSTFGGLNTPLHFAAAKGHLDIVTMLLEKGADVNARNYCGQVTRADYLSGRTALHFAAHDGFVRCVRLLLADFVPSVALEDIATSVVDGGDCQTNSGSSPNSSLGQKFNEPARVRYINKPADGGVTALHMAALNGAGSTPLHYAAGGGKLECCELLISKGASRLTLNCNGWLPMDVARIFGRRSLEALLSPNSHSSVPVFQPSSYLALPLMSILNIAREFGLQYSVPSVDDSDLCSVCLERSCSVAAEGCNHEFCIKCALYLCSTSNIRVEFTGPPGSIPCPLCRNGIMSFNKLPSTPTEGLKSSSALTFCNPCILNTRSMDSPATVSRAEIRRNRVAAVSSELVCPITCSPFPSSALPTCRCSDDDPCGATEAQDGSEVQSPRPSHSASMELDKRGEDLDRTSCSGMFWSRRSCHREQQCDAEINT
ncbi:putative E3 ubiquitin-protein ligase XBOS33 [Panicum miliaceum]|uniref:RING-type E3 ubiquitin transferase n=1 Tax=Panicum miliaceum TaxID=4540 RepID=A0A3L6TKU0_PANMI|nr:putative E3 ubiquitin-protein ligase XBOS33 [Panicum miliaceum]